MTLNQKIDFSKIKFNIDKYFLVLDTVKEYINHNGGCILHPHWVRDSELNFQQLAKDNSFKAMSWMGGGYPTETTFKQKLEDKYSLEKYFDQKNTIDVQSALYQFYRIDKFMKLNKIDNIDIIEVGGGYGRLAMMFLQYFGKRCHYVNIDFTPISLAFSYQFIQQCFPDLKVGHIFDLDEPIENYNYISLPAWKTDSIKSEFYNIAINIHSFQEMLPKSYKFYLKTFDRTLKDDGLLYLINNPPELANCGRGGYEIAYGEHYFYEVEDYFKEIDSRKYPIGADWELICGVPCLERFFVKG